MADHLQKNNLLTHTKIFGGSRIDVPKNLPAKEKRLLCRKFRWPRSPSPKYKISMTPKVVGWLVSPGVCMAVCRHWMDLGLQWYLITTHQKTRVVDHSVVLVLSTLFSGLLKPRILVVLRLNIMGPY